MGYRFMRRQKRFANSSTGKFTGANSAILNGREVVAATGTLTLTLTTLTLLPQAAHAQVQGLMVAQHMTRHTVSAVVPFPVAVWWGSFPLTPGTPNFFGGRLPQPVARNGKHLVTRGGQAQVPAQTPAARPQQPPPQNAGVYEGRIISEVAVVGAKNTNPEVVRVASGLREGTPFRSADFEAAKERIVARGYYSSLFARTEGTPDNRVRVIFEIVEYPVISNVVLTGNKSIKSSELIPLLTIKPGSVLNENDLTADVQRIQQYYLKKGYRAFIAGDPTVDPTYRVLTIPITETTIEEIRVEGNTKTKSYVITREFRSRPGSVYNEDRIQRGLSRVESLGIVHVRDSYRTEPGSELGKLNLIVPVEELRTGQVSVVFGYNTRQRLTGTLELGDTNLRGRGQGVNASYTVGGIAARSSYELGFSEPWIDSNNTAVGINVYSRILYRFNRVLASNATSGQDNTPYFEQRQGGGLNFSRPLSDIARGYLQFRLENVNANNLRVNYNSLTNDQISNVLGSLVQSGNISSVTLRTATNTRDNDLDPAGGIYFSPSVELGTARFNYERPRLTPGYISSTVTPSLPRLVVDERKQNGGFAKFNLDARRYFSLNGSRLPSDLKAAKRVFATRLLVGHSSGNIGFSEQYFLGGAETLRGYADDRFWGNNLVLATGELRIPLDRQGTLGGALFVDAGDAWGGTDVNRENIRDFAQHQNFRLNVGYGLGVRVRTPVGQVRLDYGFGETQRFHFGIGTTF